MTDQGGWYSIKTLDLYFRILYFNQQNALYEVCFMIHVLNIECKKMQIMNNIKFAVFWKYFVEIMTVLTDVSHGFPLSLCECSG